MKKQLQTNLKWFLFTLLLMSFLDVEGQVTLPHYDGLNYTVGQGLQSQSAWTTLNTGDDLVINSGNLSYSGLPASTGNKVAFSAAGIDAAKLFTQQTSGTVYYSFLLNVTSLGSLNATGGYFTSFTEGTGTNFGATVWLRSDGAGYDIGLNPRTTAANTVWSSGTTSLNTTLLVVVSYQMVGGSANDIVKLWVNPTPGLSEPAVTLTATNTTGTDLTNVNRILIRQDGASATPFVEMDELRVGLNWASVTPAGTSISTTGTLTSLVTTYGTVSSNTNFDVSGSGLSAGISVNPPVGFEVSTFSDFSSNVGTNGSPIVIGTGGTIPATTVYVRLMLTNAGSYSGNIVLSSGVTSVNVPTHGTNTINQKGLTISGLTADDKVFDNNAIATLSGTAVLNGIVSGDEPNVSISGTPTATFNDASVGNNKPVTVTGYTLSGSAAPNYSLSQPTGLTANITSSGLLDQTITFGALTPVTYGDANFNLTATASSNLTVSYMSSNTNVATVLGNVVTIVGAGSTTITASQAGDSSYNPAANVDQVLLVDPKSVTVSGATANNKEYDADTTATITGGSLVGVINSDDVSFTANGNFDTANVGTAINVSVSFVLSGADASNYTVSSQNLSADITAKPITVSGISINDKEYDTNNSATVVGSATLSGVLFADFSNVTLSGTPTALFNDASVANNKPVSVTGYSISGVASGNYSLSQPSGLTADITPKSLTIIGLTADDKVYNRDVDATVSGTATLTGIISGDESNVSLDGSATAQFLTTTVGANKPVSVTGYSISGSSIGNYTLLPLTLTASIIAKDVTIVGASANDKSYDGTTTATLNGSLDGVISPDNVALTLSGNFNNANVGTNKPVTSTSSLSGGDATNYNLIQPTGLTASIIASPCSSSTGNVIWNFTTATPSTNPLSGITISALSQGNNNGTTTLLTTTSASSGYAGASGTSNAGAAVPLGSFNASTSTYFQFTLTPQSGMNVILNSMSFGSRSTGTGPQAYTLRSSLDNYASNISTGSLSNGGSWALYNPTLSPVSTSNSGAVTFRLYAHSGAGSPSANTANWRIDDLLLNLTVAPDAALSSPLTATACSGSAFSYTPTSSYTGATITWTRDAVAGISNAAVTTPQATNPSEVLVNTTNLPVNVVYNFVVTGTTCFVTQNITVTVNPLLDWYTDNDGDTFGDSTTLVTSCTSPGANYIHAGGDCNDNNAAVNPNATEVCYDGLDNNCDGTIDEGCTPIISVVQTAQCGSTLSTISQQIYANLVAGAQGYRFRVTDTSTNQVQTIDRALRVFQLTQLANYAFDRTYQVEVSIRYNNVWQPFYGAPCTVTTPATTTKVQSAQCGSTLTTMNDVIYADNVPYATGYKFRITNLLTSAQQEIERPLRDIRMTQTSIAEFNTTYSVEVAIRNTNGLYLPYGLVCNVTTPSFPTTQLQLSQCDVTIANNNATIYADSYAGATTYRFRFVNSGLGYTYQFDRPLRSFVLSSVPGLMAGETYSVQVSVEIGGVFGPYGKVCTITTPGGARITPDAKPAFVFNAIAAPNPFGDSFRLEVSTATEETIQVKVYDMLGKLMESKDVDASTITELEVGANYPSGVYNVIVSQGEQVKTLRVIKR